MFVDFIFIVGAIFFFLSFISTNIKKSLIYQFISIVFFNLGLYLYGVIEGSLFISFISMLPMIIGFFFKEEIKRVFIKIIPFIAIISFLYLPYDFGTYLTIVGISFSSFAALSNNILKMKILYLCSNIIWLVFDIYIGSIGAIIFDIIGFIGLFLFFMKIFKEKEK